MNYRPAYAALMRARNPEKATFLQGFFKTGKGQYAEGDKFLGITVPELRKLSKGFRDLGLNDLQDFVHKLVGDGRHGAASYRKKVKKSRGLPRAG